MHRRYTKVDEICVEYIHVYIHLVIHAEIDVHFIIQCVLSFESRYQAGAYLTRSSPMS